MHIGLVVYGDLERISGGNLYDRMLVDHFAGRGHEVEVVSLPLVDYEESLAHNDDAAILERLTSAPFDVMLQDELVHPSLYRVNETVAERLEGTPIVSIVHHLRVDEDWPESERRRYREVEERYLRTVDAFVFNSQTTRESVEVLLGVKPLHVVATPGGDRLPTEIDRAAVHERSVRAADRERRFLFVGNVIPRKGLLTLIEALGSMEGSSFRLDVVGSETMDPGHAEEVRARIASHGLGERVHFHGVLSGDALVERFATSDVLVVPSTWEGFGIVYLEAMRFGLPVIAGAAGAADEIVRHERTGFLVQPGDVFGLSTWLSRLVDDGEMLTRLSITAFEAFAEHPSWEQSMTSVEAFLETL